VAEAAAAVDADEAAAAEAAVGVAAVAAAPAACPGAPAAVCAAVIAGFEKREWSAAGAEVRQRAETALLRRRHSRV
jgi:hypothetical protein